MCKRSNVCSKAVLKVEGLHTIWYGEVGCLLERWAQHERMALQEPHRPPRHNLPIGRKCLKQQVTSSYNKQQIFFAIPPVLMLKERGEIGGCSDEGTPGPIPNPVVKFVSADGTWGVSPRESRSLPISPFFCWTDNQSSANTLQHTCCYLTPAFCVVQSYPAMTQRIYCRLGAVLAAQLAQDGRHVVLHSLVADMHLVRDLFVA